MKIVEVVWVDIMINSKSAGWHSQKKLDKFICNDEHRTVTQVGYLYEEDENQIVLLDSTIGKHYGTIHTLPKGCIRRVTTIRE